MKSVVILGSTGSIGKSTLDIIRKFPEEFTLYGLAANKNIGLLLEQINDYKPQVAVLQDVEIFSKHFTAKSTKINRTIFRCGQDYLNELAWDRKATHLINAISGSSGLIPSMHCLESGKTLCLANKESMVMGGHLMRELAVKSGSKIIPVDSEHSALFHLLRNIEQEKVSSIYLTASGGPFWQKKRSDLIDIPLEKVLKHPTWDMGMKITIDSATMANKGLEIIEAHQLFGVEYERIKVIIHPQSLIHSMIETIDGEFYAQIGPNDMRLPIQNALTYPHLLKNNYNRLDPFKISGLTFFPVDENRFPMISMAYYAGKKGGNMPAVFNAMNEELVNAFIKNKIPFLKIDELLRDNLEKISLIPDPGLNEILHTDQESRKKIRMEIDKSIP